MPYYRLWRQSDNTWHGPVNARDHAHAVAIFSEQLNITLTLEEGPAAPPYMMGRVEKEVGWTKKPDIAVWEAPPSSN